MSSFSRSSHELESHFPRGAAERADAPKNIGAPAGQHSRTKGRSSTIPPEPQDNSTEEMLSGVPPQVRQTIQAQVGDGEITSIDRLTEEGMTVFDVEMRKDQVSRSFSVAVDGKLLSFEVFESELPTAVRAVVESELGSVKGSGMTNGVFGGETWESHGLSAQRD